MRTLPRTPRVWAAAVAALALQAVPASALPPGRAWLPVDTLKVPGHTWIAPQVMEADPAGKLLLYAGIVGGLGRDTYGFEWTGSQWSETWQLGYGTGFLWPVPAPPGRYPLVWKGIVSIDEGGLSISPIVMSEAIGNAVLEPDTALWTVIGDVEYAAAMATQRRWVVAHDIGRGGGFPHDLRLVYSDAAGIWREIQVAGSGDLGVSVIALDDTSALVAWTGTFDGPGIRWGTLHGNTWKQGESDPWAGQLYLLRPRLRSRPSGGYWLAWAADSCVVISTWRDGAWDTPERIDCAYRRPGFYISGSTDASRDDGEFPVLAWSSQNALAGAQTTLCVCVPNDSGFTVADEIEGSEEVVLHAVARDRNGDVWVAWWRYFDGMFWTHTYTTATASRPSVTGSAGVRQVRWTLSEPAPETWWAVLRSVGGTEYEEVARVRATWNPMMSWTDPAPNSGSVRYRIRRECLDKRYEWLSEPSVGVLRTHRVLALSLVSSPVRGMVEVEVTDAAQGRLEVTLFDLQGRVAMRRERMATGSGSDSIRLDVTDAPNSIAPGVYFLQARDASGRTSAAVKVAIVR